MLSLRIESTKFIPCHLTKIILFYVHWQKYQWASDPVTACQVSSLIKLIKQKDKQCLAEWILGSGNANRCAFLSFSIQWHLTIPAWTISRMLLGLLKKGKRRSKQSFAELLWKTSLYQFCVHVGETCFFKCGALVCSLLLMAPMVHSVHCYIWLAAEVNSAHLVPLTHNLRFAASEEEDRRALACCIVHSLTPTPHLWWKYQFAVYLDEEYCIFTNRIILCFNSSIHFLYIVNIQ